MNPPVMHDATWYEHQYNPRVTVSHVSDIIAGWRRRSAAFRNRCEPLSDFKYGPHPRETVDLFRAPNPKGTLVYIHGGYWRMLSKLETSFVAEAFLAEGYSVVLVNYPLCPDVSLPDIRHAMTRCFLHLTQAILNENEKTSIVVSGHSAGGHLAALHVAVHWSALQARPPPINGIVSLSGVFDVAPLIHTSMNADIRLDDQTAATMNLMTAEPINLPPMVLAVGGDEPEEFHRQSTRLAAAWHLPPESYMPCAARNHFTILEAFADPDTNLHARVLHMLASGRGRRSV
jgi:arylformamidase